MNAPTPPPPPKQEDNHRTMFLSFILTSDDVGLKPKLRKEVWSDKSQWGWSLQFLIFQIHMGFRDRGMIQMRKSMGVVTSKMTGTLIAMLVGFFLGMVTFFYVAEEAIQQANQNQFSIYERYRE